MRKTWFLNTIVALFGGMALIVLTNTIQTVNAAGVTVNLSPSTLSAATPTDVTVSFTPTTGYSSGNTVTIIVDAGVTISNTCAVPTTDSAAPAGTDGSGSVLGQSYTYTYTTSTNASVVHSFCIRMTAATGNYGITMSSTNNFYGGALLYVGNANVVSINAKVAPTLAFQIVTTGDINTTTNTCDLSTLSLASVNTCDYRLKVATNSTSGFYVNINSNGDFSRAGPGLVTDPNDIDPIGEAIVTSGTEGYGLRVAAGTITGGTIAAQGNFTSDDSSVPTSSTLLLQSTGTNNPTTPSHTSLVTHRAAIDGDTGPGLYQQTITYTVTASF